MGHYAQARLGAAIAFALTVISVFIINQHSRLVDAKNRAVDAFTMMEGYLSKRNSLVNDLIENAEGKADQEKVDALRNAKQVIDSTEKIGERIEKEGILADAITALTDACDSISELAESADYKHIKSELADTDRGITVFGNNYNTYVEAFKTRRGKFPGSMAAKLFKVADIPYFPLRKND